METGHRSTRAVNSGSGNRALCCGQTDKQTDRQTASNVLPTPTDAVNVGNKSPHGPNLSLSPSVLSIIAYIVILSFTSAAIYGTEAMDYCVGVVGHVGVGPALRQQPQKRSISLGTHRSTQPASSQLIMNHTRAPCAMSYNPQSLKQCPAYRIFHCP